MQKSVVKSALFALAITTLFGCATMEKAGVPKFDEIFKTSGKKSAEIAAKYPRNQVPHTLSTKPVAAGRLTSGFGYRLSPTGIPIPKKHKGIDYAAPVGTPIIAAGSGKVIKKYVSSSFGNFIRIQHANGFTSSYAHLDTFAAGTDVGAAVQSGQIIGTMGSTGSSTASHLHYELAHNGVQIDPFLGRDPASLSSASTAADGSRQ